MSYLDIADEEAALFAKRSADPWKPVFSVRLALCAWMFWSFFAAYLYLMPTYVPYLNAHFANNTCTTPTWQMMENDGIYCVNGADLTQLATEHQRFNRNGDPVACGCGEGIFGEDICPLGFAGHPKIGGATVSNYIGTPTGAGSWTIISAGPIAMAWIYGTGSTDMLHLIGADREGSRLMWLAKATWYLFQAMFWLFCCSPGCILYGPHKKTTAGFAIGAILHFVCVGLLPARKRVYAPLAIVVMVIGVFLFCMINFKNAAAQYKGCNVDYPGQDISESCKEVLKYDHKGFWFEASSILSILAVSPALMTWAALHRSV